MNNIFAKSEILIKNVFSKKKPSDYNVAPTELSQKVNVSLILTFLDHITILKILRSIKTQSFLFWFDFIIHKEQVASLNINIEKKWTHHKLRKTKFH